MSTCYRLALADGPPVCLPEGKEAPFGWPALRVDERGVRLRWAEPLCGVSALRFTVAIDLREALMVELVLADSGYRIGHCEVGYGYPLQTFEIALAPGLEAAITQQGVRLRVCHAGKAFWIFGPHPGTVPEALSPLLFQSGAGLSSRWEASFESLCSAASLQIFGWLEGCVLEGLCELALRRPDWKERADAAVQLHLDHFLSGDRLIYVSPRSERVEDRWHNNEHGLMLPALLRFRPEHPAIKQFCDTWIDYLHRQIEQLERNLSCEACYTLAYPIALMGRQRGDERLIELALKLLLLHQHHLKSTGTLHLQYNYRDGTTIYPNWLRGEAWYLLGHARVLALARESHAPERRLAEKELTREIARILPLQNERGLWSCFAHQPETGDETSGSAGVAAALLLAAELGCAGESAITAAKMTLNGLTSYLSPDGLLSGVSQSNKIEAGEALQRYGFRCRSQMGQGLAVQLAAMV